MSKRNSDNPMIFLSYNRRDRRLAERLASVLERNNVDVWLDQWRVYAGDSLADSIGAAIEKCDAFILIASRSSMQSNWVRQELQLALDRRTSDPSFKLITIKIDKCRVHPFLRGYLWLEYNPRLGIKSLANEVVSSIHKQERHMDPYASHFQLIQLNYAADFSGKRAAMAVVEEEYQIFALAKLARIYQHIYHAGPLLEISAVSHSPGVVLELEPLETMTALERFQIRFVPPQPKGSRCKFVFRHVATNCFTNASEFLYYNVESHIERINFKLRFSAECSVKKMRLYRRLGQKEILIHTFRGSRRIQYSESQPKLLTSYVFRWSWAE